MNNTQVVKYNKTHFEELVQFITENYENNHPLSNVQLFDWMYSSREIYIYIDDNKIVGFNNYIKAQYQYHNDDKKQLINGIQFAMSKVLDKYNGLNIILEPHKEYDLICGMGFNRKTILPILKQLDYTVIDTVPRVHISLSSFSEINDKSDKQCAIIENINCKELETLWLKSTENTKVCGIVRDETFWRWRYIDNPPFKCEEKYQFYGNFEVGMIVFRKEQYLDNYAVRIVELIPYNNQVWSGKEDAGLNDLIRKFCNWCFNINCTIIDFYCTHLKLLETLKINNFQTSDITIPNNFGNPEKRYPELNYVINSKQMIDINNLYETKSCGDMDRPDGLVNETKTKTKTETKTETTGYKIALLSSVNIDPLKKSVSELVSNYIQDVNIYTYEYGQLHQELLFEDSELFKHNPDIIIIIDRPEDILNKSLDEYSNDDKSKISAYFDAIRTYISTHSTTQIFIMEYYYTEKTTCFNCIDQSILNNFNDHLQTLKNEFPLNVDIMNIQSNIDCEILDKRMWYIGKIPYTKTFFDKLSTKIVGLILSMKGLTARLLVLDLDNTLWGGVVGEDGVHGIQIGEDYPGNIFRDFQKKIKLLKERGVALSICSKNDITIVNEVFEKNNNMVLKKEDFVFIYANWNNKFENIKEISKKIGLGLKNILFIDDNPVERDQVTQFLPEVQVLNLPKDPIDYIDCLLESPLLELHKLTDSDKTRAETYINKVKVDELKTTFTNKEDFYKQLELEIYIHNLTNENKDRCVQLINKTNQFNATTMRLTEIELTKYKIYVLGAKDKYNNYENMGVMVTSETKDSLTIENYLLSCRFLGKGLENEFIKWILHYAKSLKYTTVYGKIVITERNEPARNIYKQNDFVFENERYAYMIDENTNIEFKEYIKMHDTTSDISNTKLDVKSNTQIDSNYTQHVDVSDINPRLINIIRNLIDIDAQTVFNESIESNKLNDALNYLPSWSSLKHIMLINIFEGEFSQKMDIKTMIDIKTISQLNTIIPNTL